MAKNIFTENDYWRIVLNGYKKDGGLPHGDRERLVVINEHAVQQLKSIMLELIGEDDVAVSVQGSQDPGDSGYRLKRIDFESTNARNDLRSELRKRVEAL